MQGGGRRDSFPHAAINEQRIHSPFLHASLRGGSLAASPTPSPPPLHRSRTGAFDPFPWIVLFSSRRCNCLTTTPALFQQSTHNCSTYFSILSCELRKFELPMASLALPPISLSPPLKHWKEASLRYISKWLRERRRTRFVGLPRGRVSGQGKHRRIENITNFDGEIDRIDPQTSFGVQRGAAHQLPFQFLTSESTMSIPHQQPIQLPASATFGRNTTCSATTATRSDPNPDRNQLPRENILDESPRSSRISTLPSTSAIFVATFTRGSTASTSPTNLGLIADHVADVL